MATPLTVTNAGTFDLAHGSLALKADGNYAYTLDNTNPAVNALNDGQTLTDAFTYQISDGHGGTSSAALTVTIRGTTDTPANTPPTAFADAVSIKEDTAPNPVVGNVLANDQDADGDTADRHQRWHLHPGPRQSGSPRRWQLRLHPGQHQPGGERAQ